MKRIFASVLCLALTLPSPSMAQSVTGEFYYPGADRNGRLGIVIEDKEYNYQGFKAIKVINSDDSLFFGIKPGDYIVAINGHPFNDFKGFSGLVNENAPGDWVWVAFLDSAQNYRRMRQRAQLRDARQFSQENLHKFFDYTSFLNQLVYSDSKGWSWNTYDQESMHNVSYNVFPDGSQVIIGYYSYSGGTQDWVKAYLTSDGKVRCLEYRNYSCRAPYGPGEGNYLAKTVGAVVVLALAGAVLSSGSSSGSSSSTSRPSGADTERERQNEERRRQQEDREREREKQPRTYGLYGDCPQPGAGYGC